MNPKGNSESLKPFTKNDLDKRASKAGKKSTHGVSVVTSLKKLLQLPASFKITKSFLKKLGLSATTERYQKKQLVDLINLALIAQAINGNIPAIKEINDRIDGRTGLTIQEEDGEISLVFKVKKAPIKSVKKLKATKKKLVNTKKG